MDKSSVWKRFWNFIFKNIIVEIVVAVVAGIVVAMIIREGKYANPAAPTSAISSTAGASTVPVESLTSTPIKIPTDSTKRGNVLFSENFENGTSEKFRAISGLWKVVEDETGNWVYETNNKGKQNWSSVMFGANEWDNYIIEYKVKLVDLSYSPYYIVK